MAANLERRIEKLEAALPSDTEQIHVVVVSFEPWCSAGLHTLPNGYLRGYGSTDRKPGESEDELKERVLAIAKEKRNHGVISLVENREAVECTEHVKS